MGSPKSGNRKLTDAQRRRAIQLLTRKRKPWRVLQVAWEFKVSPQYLYQLLNNGNKKD